MLSNINFVKFLLFRNLKTRPKYQNCLLAVKMQNESSQTQPIEIDGSYLEGGGQILRILTALSAILNKPIKVMNIRKGRDDGGLKPQHLTSVTLLGEICKAKLHGAEIKSSEIEFTPDKLYAGSYMADTKTAGSLTLLLQNLVPALIFADRCCELQLRGGTNVSFSPQIDEFQEIFVPIVEKHFGIKLECKVMKKGFYPQGGGEVYVKTYPLLTELKPINLTDFGDLMRIRGRAFVAGYLPIKIAQRMAHAASNQLQTRFSNCSTNGRQVKIEIEAIKESAHSAVGTATGIVLFAETSTGCLLSSSSLGKKGVAAEEVAQKAVDFLVNEIEARNCVDEHMQDQLIIFMALAKGESLIRSGPLSLHTKTAIHFAQLFTGAKFEAVSLDDKNDSSIEIRCVGIGHRPRN